MKVKYKTRVLDGSLSHEEEQYQEFCCEDMKFAWEEIFTIGSSESSGWKSQESTGIRLIVSREHGPYGESWTEEKPINFCPFCGEKIEYVETSREEFERKPIERVVKDFEWVKK